MEIAKGLGRLFYLINPNETSFEKLEDLPNPGYFNQAYPYFVVFLILEIFMQKLKDKPRTRINDGITSASLGMMWESVKILVRGVESYFYVKIYENWRVYDLPWDSPMTWYICAIGVDFCYYWFHRASHEINFFWAHHQVHHSSEDYNLTTALRQSAFQGWVAWVFYLPLAFFIPPSIFIIHQQFNLLYQFWIHTEVVDDLGPLEYILNTAKHHRIHHGSNRYCLDKNYAGVLIIWDRMFGTFEKEKENEPIIYGLVEDIKSFNPFWLQYFYGQKLWAKFESNEESGDKISSVLKGPGWTKGKPRLGDPMDCPEYPKRERHHIKIAKWKNWYVVVHFLVVLVGFDYLSKNSLILDQGTVLCSLLFVVYCLTSIGIMIEDRVIGIYSEILRSLFVLIVVNYFDFKYNGIIRHLLTIIFVTSIIILNVNLLTGWGNNPKNHKGNTIKHKNKFKKN